MAQTLTVEEASRSRTSRQALWAAVKESAMVRRNGQPSTTSSGRRSSSSCATEP